MRIFVTGASGLIGRRLVRALLARGDAVVPLSRKPTSPNSFGPGDCTPVVGDASRPGSWLDTMAGCDAVVHLAGEPILAKRWSAEFLTEVRRSRVESTKLIAERVKGTTVKVLVSGSAVGYYGNVAGDAEITESSPAGTDVLGTMCVEWEAAADAAHAAGVRVVHPRTGIVLDPEGGALPQMAAPFRWFVGGKIGSGKQWVPWIHYADMTGLLLFALDTPTLAGPMNAVAPHPVTNAEFSAVLAKVLKRPNLFPAPVFMLKLLIGGGAEVVAGGQRAVPKVATEAGYRFRFERVQLAVGELHSAKPLRGEGVGLPP